MLNVGGGELVLIALVALIALGPEQLPGVMRKLGALSKQVRSISTGLREEFLSGLEDVPGVGRPGTTPKPKPKTTFDPDEPIVPRGFAQQQAAERAREEAELARRATEPGHSGLLEPAAPVQPATPLEGSLPRRPPPPSHRSNGHHPTTASSDTTGPEDGP